MTRAGSRTGPSYTPLPADVLLSDGSMAVIRAVRPDDVPELHRLHDKLDDENYRLRFFGLGRQGKVEVKIDDGPWMEAAIDHSEEAEFAWQIWHLDWENPATGEHTVTSRAIDVSGQIQPAMDDPWIAKKKTYWESNGQVTRRINIS